MAEMSNPVDVMGRELPYSQRGGIGCNRQCAY